MQKKKSAGKKKTAKKAAKKRSQKVNKPIAREAAAEEGSAAGSTTEARGKVICFNTECRLRRAGCYGYEACPGFKSKE